MKDQWISVNDRLPEKGLHLVYGESETSPPTMQVAEYDSEWGWTGPLSVTHWRELPLPPEAANPLPFLPPGFQLLLDKVAIDGLTGAALEIRRGEARVSVDLDTVASPYPFHEKTASSDAVLLELQKGDPYRIAGTGTIVEATTTGFVWAGAISAST